MKAVPIHSYMEIFACDFSGGWYNGECIGMRSYLMIYKLWEMNREDCTMEVSYKKLWKLLIDKDMKKKDLQAQAGISWTSVTKLSKGENVSMEVLMKVCKALECNIGDIMDLIPEEGEDNAEQ